MARSFPGLIALMLLVSEPGRVAVASTAGTPLTLREALARALIANPELVAARAGAEQGQARSDEAASFLLPRLDFSESWSRGDNPVYAFGTRLEQGRFGAQDFALDSLNHPAPISNHETSLRAEWALLDPASFAGLRGAKASRSMAQEASLEAEQSTLVATLRSYFAAALAERSVAVIVASLEAATRAVVQAEARRDAGLLSEADVLALRVHAAALLPRQIRAQSRARLAMAELDRSMGEPLDRDWNLVTPLSPSGGEGGPGADEAEEVAAQASPAAALARQSVELAVAERERSRMAYLPALSVYGGWQLDRPEMFEGGEDSWMAGVALRVNLFNGLGDRARELGAAAGERKARADSQSALADIRLGARRAVLERDAARAELQAAAAVTAAARESRRVTAARFDAGLVPASELLSAESALLDAELRALEASFAARLAVASVAQAMGQLDAESEVFKP